MKSYLRLLPDDYDSHNRVFNAKLQQLYQQDSEHVAVVTKKPASVSLSKSDAKIYRLDEVYSETTPDAQAFSALSPVFYSLLDGVNYNLILLSTYDSVISQVKRRVPDASPNQRVPYAVEFAFCPHQDSIVNQLLYFVGQQQQKIVQINVEFNLLDVEVRRTPNYRKGEFEPSEIQHTSMKLRNLIFNQPVHPDVLRDKIMPQVVKNAVSQPCMLRLKVTTTDLYELRSRQATLQIGVVPKICSDYSVKLPVPSALGEQFQREQQMLFDAQEKHKDEMSAYRFGALDQLNKSVYRSSIEVGAPNGRLADRIKAQRCQCVERRGSQQLLVKNVGIDATSTTRRFYYQLFDKRVQYMNNSCYFALQNALGQMALRQGSEYQAFQSISHPFLAEYRRCFAGLEQIVFMQFAGVSDSSEDTFRLLQTLARARKLKIKPQGATETITIDRDEYEFLKSAAARGSTLRSDYAALREDYQSYLSMSQSQMALLRERGNCVVERAALLRAYLQESRYHFQAQQEESIRLQDEVSALEDHCAALRHCSGSRSPTTSRAVQLDG